MTRLTDDTDAALAAERQEATNAVIMAQEAQAAAESALELAKSDDAADEAAIADLETQVAALKKRIAELENPTDPTPTNHMLIGVNQGRMTQLLPKLTGKKLEVRRSYGGGADSCVTLANEDKAAGRVGWVSMSSWPGDAALDAFLKKFTSKTMLTYGHEVDLVKKEVTDAAEFKRRHNLLYDRAKAVNPLVEVGPIFTANPFRTGSASNGTPITSWIPDRMHFLGIDAYHLQRPPGSTPDPKTGNLGTARNMQYLLGEQKSDGTAKQGAVYHATQHGVKIAIGEYGFHPDPAKPQYRPDWLKATDAYLKSVGCKAAAYFHSPLGASGPWVIDQYHVFTADEKDPARLTGKADPDSLAAFKALLPNA